MKDILTNARNIRALLLKIVNGLSDEDASIAPDMFPKLKEDNELISAGTRINWNGIIKKASVDLWDTVENNPDNAPNLWNDINYKNGIRIIPDTIDASNSFNINEYGYYRDTLYQSLIDNNVWTPIDYPSGWKEMGGEE